VVRSGSLPVRWMGDPVPVCRGRDLPHERRQALSRFNGWVIPCPCVAEGIYRTRAGRLSLPTLWNASWYPPGYWFLGREAVLVHGMHHFFGKADAGPGVPAVPYRLPAGSVVRLWLSSSIDCVALRNRRSLHGEFWFLPLQPKDQAKWPNRGLGHLGSPRRNTNH